MTFRPYGYHVRANGIRLHLLRYTGAKTADEIRTALLPYAHSSGPYAEGARMARLETADRCSG